jgi:hypothetical protein
VNFAMTKGEIKMKRKTNLLLLTTFLVLSLTLTAVPQSTQSAVESQRAASSPLKTNGKMLYHDGPVRTFVQNVYFIFYGCWTNSLCGRSGDTTTMDTVRDFTSLIGGTSYMQINSTYANSTGQPASPWLVYAGSVVDDSYAHGVDLTRADIEGIISDQILSFNLPQDPQGIYVVVASGDIASTATGFCTPGVRPFHASAIINGGLLAYVFLGNPIRCPSAAAPFVGQPSPNGSFAGDALVLNLAHALNGLLTNPYGNGWYDRYGLENSDKCTGTFGQIYTTANGARANFSVGGRDYLLEQNWVNDRRGGCAMSP